MEPEEEGVDPSISDPIAKLRRGEGGGDGEGQQQQQQQRQRRQQQQQQRLSIERAYRINWKSVQYLVDFLRSDDSPCAIRELSLSNFTLAYPSDGGFQILRDYIANDSTLTKINLSSCDFGGPEEISQLCLALHASTSLTDLFIWGIANLQGVAVGNFLSTLLQNNEHLQKLSLVIFLPNVQTVRAFQRGLGANRHLETLCLTNCGINDEGFRCIVDALLGNATLEVLHINGNVISTNGLDDIIRLIESTRVKTIKLGDNHVDLFSNEAGAQRFADVLSRNKFLHDLDMFHHDHHPYLYVSRSPPIFVVAKVFQALERNTTLESLSFGSFSNEGLQNTVDRIVESLPRIKGLKRLVWRNWGCFFETAAFLTALHQNTSLEECVGLPMIGFSDHDAKVVAIKNILARNRSMRRADALLQPQARTGTAKQDPFKRTGQAIGSKSGIWPKAMARLAPESSGASAIYRILQKRVVLFEKPLVRRQPAQSVTAVQRNGDSPGSSNDNVGRKRARLSR